MTGFNHFIQFPEICSVGRKVPLIHTRTSSQKTFTHNERLFDGNGNPSGLFTLHRCKIKGQTFLLFLDYGFLSILECSKIKMV